MRRILRGRLLLVAAAVATMLPATARANPVFTNNVLTASRAQIGVINLAYTAPYRSRVEFSERIGGRIKPLGTSMANTMSPSVAFLRRR